MRDIRRPLIIAFIAVATVVPGTQLGAASQELAPALQRAEGQLRETESTALSAYVLGPDDQIRIQVADVPDISDKPQRLDPDGDLRLPMVGRVHAAGMTLEQLQAELKTRLKVYIQEPDVAVSVAEFRSQPVSVIGAVKASGVHQLEGRKTLIEVLSLAGGVDNAAGPTARITRRPEFGRIPLPDAATDSAGDFSIVEIDLKALLEAKTPERNIVIRPHDVISIPRAEVVYVIGEVGNAGAVPLSASQSISVIEAVSASGGTLRTAAPKQARVLRRVAGNERRTELRVDLQAIMAGKADDLPLIAGDILVVPDSSGKRFTTRVIEAAIQAGTLIGSYGLVR